MSPTSYRAAPPRTPNITRMRLRGQTAWAYVRRRDIVPLSAGLPSENTDLKASVDVRVDRGILPYALPIRLSALRSLASPSNQVLLAGIGLSFLVIQARSARRKAEILAATTAGVLKVLDELTLTTGDLAGFRQNKPSPFSSSLSVPVDCFDPAVIYTQGLPCARSALPCSTACSRDSRNKYREVKVVLKHDSHPAAKQ